MDDRTSTPRDPPPEQRRDDAAARRDHDAADRDERAAVQDTAASARDRVAAHRDRGAFAPDAAAGRRSHETLDRLLELQQQIDDLLRRHADAVADVPVDGLPPTVLGTLRAHAAEQRRLVELDRKALAP